MREIDAAEIGAQAQEIIAYMPDWSYELIDWHGRPWHTARRDTGLVLHFYDADGRLGIEDVPPEYPDGSLFYFSTYSEASNITHRITVATNKKALTIAKDVAKRLVDGCQERAELALAAIATQVEREKARETAIRRLARLMNQPVRDEWLRRERTVDMRQRRPETTSYEGMELKINSGSSFSLTVDLSNLDHMAELVRSVQQTMFPDYIPQTEQPACDHVFHPSTTQELPQRYHRKIQDCSVCGWIQTLLYRFDDQLVSTLWTPPTEHTA